MSQIKSLFIVVSYCFLYAVESLPNGAPTQACDTLSPDPGPHGALPQTTPVPYSIDLSPFADGSGGYSYQPGETYNCKWSCIGTCHKLSY